MVLAHKTFSTSQLQFFFLFFSYLRLKVKDLGQLVVEAPSLIHTLHQLPEHLKSRWIRKPKSQAPKHQYILQNESFNLGIDPQRAHYRVDLNTRAVRRMRVVLFSWAYTALFLPT